MNLYPSSIGIPASEELAALLGKPRATVALIPNTDGKVSSQL